MMRSRRAVRRATSMVAVLLVAALAGCSSDFGAEHGATDRSRSMSDLWRGGVMAAIAVGGVVLALIIWCLLRYRRRGRDDIPGQRQYHLGLEILYTAIPIVIVVVLFGFSYAVQDDVDALAAHPDVTVEVRGFQWQWQFHYRNEGCHRHRRTRPPTGVGVAGRRDGAPRAHVARRGALLLRARLSCSNAT